MDAHVITWKKLAQERQDGWRINESVWDWLIRKTNIRTTKANIRRLADEMFIGEATLHRLKKTKQHSINRESLRKQLSRHPIEIPGTSEQQLLGYYGYPPETKYVDPSYTTLSKAQRNINGRLKSDFDKVIDTADVEEDVCHFCQPISYDLTPDEDSSKIQCVTIFLSTHRYKQYGAASRQKGKGFELGISLCRNCLRNYYGIFLIPVSSLITKTLKKYRFKQPQLAKELGVPQGVVSRLLHDKTVFINPSLLKKIFGLYRIGPDSYYRSEHWKLLLIIVDYLADKLNFNEMCLKMDEYDPKEPVWKHDPSLLEQMDIIKPTESNDFDSLYDYRPFNYEPEEQQAELSHCNTQFLGLNFDSNEISCWYEVDYRYSRMIHYPDVEEVDCGGGTVILKYVLINIQRRLNLDFWSEESTLEYLQIESTEY